ncbi:MAG TPA: phage major tail tube protein [Sphingopyxis sp.]|nr:phage major tail tube protein [Sphingopyxis sp.]
MGLPSKLKNFRLYNDGNNYQGIVGEFTQPKIALQMEEWRGGGMLGPVKIDMGLQLMEAEFTNGGLVKQVMRQFGSTSVDGVLLRLVGAYQSDDTGNVDQVELVMRGRLEELDMGNAKAGEDTEHKVKVPLAYYKISVNGRTEIEIDMLNSIFIVDGVDRYAEIRSALGG